MVKKRKAKKAADPAMSGDDFARGLAKLGLSVYASGKVVGLSLRQAQRVAASESPVPRPVVKLMNLMLKRKITVEEAIEAG